MSAHITRENRIYVARKDTRDGEILGTAERTYRDGVFLGWATRKPDGRLFGGVDIYPAEHGAEACMAWMRRTADLMLQRRN